MVVAVMISNGLQIQWGNSGLVCGGELDEDDDNNHDDGYDNDDDGDDDEDDDDSYL